MEKKIDEQSNKIAEIHHDRLMLVQDNQILKEQTQKLLSDIQILVTKSHLFGSGDTNEAIANESQVMMSLMGLQSTPMDNTFSAASPTKHKRTSAAKRERPSYRLFEIAESHLCPEIASRLVEIDRFSLLRQDRNHDGEGVTLYVHNSLKAEVLTTSSLPESKGKVLKYLLCSVQERRAAPIFIAVIYRPSHILWLKGADLIEKLNLHAEDFSHKIIMGEFNADLLTTKDDAKFLKKLAKNLGLKIV